RGHRLGDERQVRPGRGRPRSWARSSGRRSRDQRERRRPDQGGADDPSVLLRRHADGDHPTPAEGRELRMSRKPRTNRPALAVGFLIACVAVSAMMAASLAFAQEETRSARSRLGLVQTGPGRFSIDVQGADIHTVLRAIAEFSGKNIVAGSAVKGQITVALHDMPWRDALTTITRANGLDFTEEAGAIRVDTGEKLQAELLARETNEARRLEVLPLQTRIIHLNYGAARELQPVLQSTLSKRGSIQIDERTNSVVVTDVADNVDAIE